MRAGYQKIKITPTVGTRMSGFGRRDESRASESIHDDLHARILHLEHDGEEAVIIGFDLLFFSRANAAWLKDSIGGLLDLRPRQILLNTSHTHTGPCVDLWHMNRFHPADTGYMQTLVRSICNGVRTARDQARAVELWAGTGQSRLPVSRRKPDGRGGIDWLPHFEGEVCRNLPVCLLKDTNGQPVCLLYSISCHPSIVHDWSISADYPGPACDALDAHLGVDCSLFLQGAAGDSKPCVIAEGEIDGHPGIKSWRCGDWDDVAEAGRIVADEVVQTIDSGLEPCSPSLSTSLSEVFFDLAPHPGEAILEERTRSENPGRVAISQHMLSQIRMGRDLETSAGILIQGIRLSETVRMVAIEAEIVSELGNRIISAFPSGTTFALGYSNGTGLYLPSDRMLTEGGYEVISHHEYGYASPLAPGIDETLLQATTLMHGNG
ncbi:MAG: hypothetical protein DRP71_08205 [Verrucomicrobia bacterium]|nr:MAG: hypothetical protein DRP71_08205 [Verrucomicrobiota bacterium]